MPGFRNDYGRDFRGRNENPQWPEGGSRTGYPAREGWYGGGSHGYGGSRSGAPGGFQQGYEYEDWGPLPDEFSGRGTGADPMRYGGYGTGAGARPARGDYGSEMEFGGRGREMGGFRGGPPAEGPRPEYGGSSGYRGGAYPGAGYGGGYEAGYEGGHGGYGRELEGSGGSWGGRPRARASEIMTENPEVVTPDATLAEAAAKMRELNVGIIPVVDSMDNRRLRGVITDRDIAIRAVAEGKDGQTKVSDCMTSDVETVNKNDGIDRVLATMEREQVRRVPVTDREGRVVGIIAQADLAVDYGEGRPQAARRVQNAVERISEPARPERGAGMRAEGGKSRAGGKSSGKSQSKAESSKE